MRRWVVTLVVALVAVVAGVALWRPLRNSGGSSLGHGPEGWLAARLYLEARGGRAALLDRPFAAGAVGPVLLTAQPWSHGGGDPAGLRDWVRSGGILVVGYSGRTRLAAERRLLTEFEIGRRRARPEPPWGFFGWRRFIGEQWRLAPAAELGGDAAPVVVGAFDLLPVAPPGSSALYRHPASGAPVVWSVAVGRGALLLLPADALANARLLNPGNADLAQTLIGWLGTQWTFDEFHHGLVDPAAAAPSPPLAYDLFGAHLALLYGLGVAALARRFGPAWREPAVRVGSTGAFLLGLGRLHDRLGHHSPAAQRLLARARELQPDLALPEGLDERARQAGAAELVAIARAVTTCRRQARSASGARWRTT
jgi:hypothetical protein